MTVFRTESPTLSRADARQSCPASAQGEQHHGFREISEFLLMPDHRHRKIQDHPLLFGELQGQDMLFFGKDAGDVCKTHVIWYHRCLTRSALLRSRCGMNSPELLLNMAFHCKMCLLSRILPRPISPTGVDSTGWCQGPQQRSTLTVSGKRRGWTIF